MRRPIKTMKTENEKRKSENGVTWKVFVGLLYGIFVFQPAMIWLNLSTGGSLAAGWVTFLIFTEIARLSAKSLSKTESVVILNLAGMSYFSTFITLIYRAYFARSEITRAFGISDYVPSWWAPLGDRVWLSRTFIDQSWLVPIGLTLLIILLGIVADLAMGLLTREIYVVQENLPFPLQQVAAEGVKVLVEREERRMNVFTIAATFASIYAAFLYVPSVLLRALGYFKGELPIPWVDLSKDIQRILPGAAFGISTDVFTFAGGFIIPFSVVVNIFVGSMIIYVIGNHLLVNMGITRFAEEYYTGMRISEIMYKSHMYAWAGPLIGVAFAAGIFPVIHRYKIFVQGIKSLMGSKTKTHEAREESFLSLPVLLIAWFGSSLASVFIAYYLLEGIGITFLVIMIFFSLGWSFLWTLVNARALGITGVTIEPPGTLYPIVKYSYISTLPQARYDAWFIDPIISMGGASWCATFKLLDLVGCKIKTYLKSYFIILPVVIITGFLYVQVFWWMAPMPSSVYPMTAVQWPLNVGSLNLWITGKIFTAFDPLWIVSAFVITGILYVIGAVTHLPISVIGLAAGVNTIIPTAFTMLIGGIFGEIMRRRYGENWNRDRTAVAAGISLGASAIITIITTATMLVKSQWALPY